MEIFPLDPTPFVIPYAILVFVVPFIVFLYYNLQKFIFVCKEEDSPFWIFYSLKEKLRIVRELTQKNPEYKIISRKVEKMLVVTLFCWILGFTILCTTVFLMDQNNLLINHSKGLYGSSEK